MKDFALYEKTLEVKIDDQIIRTRGRHCSDVLKDIIVASLNPWVFSTECVVRLEGWEKSVFLYLKSDNGISEEFIFSYDTFPTSCHYYNAANMKKLLNNLKKFIKRVEDWIDDVKTSVEDFQYTFHIGNKKKELRVFGKFHYSTYGVNISETKVMLYELNIEIDGKKVPNNAKSILGNILKVISPLYNKQNDKEKFIESIYSGPAHFTPNKASSVKEFKSDVYDYFHNLIECLNGV